MVLSLKVALDLIKERRKMVSKVAESENKNKVIAQLLQKEQEDSQKSENSKLLQLEACMEKHLMDFDIEREQYKARLRKEEGKVKDLLLQLTDIKETVLSLQEDSIAESTSGLDSTDSSCIPEGMVVTSISLTKSISTKAYYDPPLPNHQIDSLLTTSAGESVLQQTARIDPGPSLSPPPKQAADFPRVPLKIVSVPAGGNRARLAGNVASASPKPVTHILQGPDMRVSNNIRSKTATDVTQAKAIKSSSPASVTVATKPQLILGNTKQDSVIKTNETASGSSAAGKSIPTRTSVRVNNSNNNSSPVILPKPANKLANKSVSTGPLKVSTAANNAANRTTLVTTSYTRPAGLSPRSVAVPPHLGPQGGKLITTSSWRNSVSGSTGTSKEITNARSNRPASTSSLSPTETVSPGGGSSGKPKPPPPVRNVSLPHTKKYQSIENTSSS